MVGLNLSDLQRPSGINKQNSIGMQENPQGNAPQEQENQEQVQNDSPISLSQLQTPSTYQAEPEKSDEGWLSYLGRQSLRSASRLGEQVLGAAGNIHEMAKNVAVATPKYLGPVGDAIYDLVGEKGWEKLIRGSEPDNQMLPTSQQLKSTSQKISGGLTTPQTPGEEKADQFIEDVGATINPSGKFSVARNLSMPAAANVGKEMVDYLGFGNDAANKAKLAIWLPLMLSHSVNGPKHASNLMNEGREGIPNTVQMNTPRFSNALDRIERNLLTSDPRTALARQTISGLRNDISNGQTSAQSLMTMYDAVNAAKRNKGMFDMGRADRAFAVRSIDQVRHAVRDELMQSASAYPKALNSWQNGVGAWATVHRSRAITNYLERVAKGPYAKILTGPAAALFGVGSYGISQAPRYVSGSIAAAIPAGIKTGQVLFRALNNKTLAGYYFNAIRGAMNENLPVFLNNYNKLNKEMKD